VNIQKREWQPNSPDPFVGSTDTYVDSDTLFSDYLRSRSPSISVPEIDDCNAEPTAGLFGRISAPTPSTVSCSAASTDNDLNQLHEECQHCSVEVVVAVVVVVVTEPTVDAVEVIVE
jgi:hypothetical protein